MTAQTRATLKTYFQTGSKPTAAQFANTIDSFISELDTGGQVITSDVSALGSFSVSASFNAGSVVIGVPTGGNKGIGTLNATGIYVNGTLITTTSAGGSGTVNAGTANQIAYYPSSTNSVSGTNALPNGTTATTQSTGDNSTKVATTSYVDTNKAPLPTNSTIVGQFLPLSSLGSTVTLPAGGSWGYMVLSLNASSVVQAVDTVAAIASGGSVISPPGASFCTGFCWRIT